jgi:hypothetical protein
VTLEDAMMVAKVGGRDATDRAALYALRLEVMRLGLLLDSMREELWELK